jgi:uncharacterized protein YjlB
LALTSADLLVIPSRRGTKTNQPTKIQEKANPDDEQSRKILSLRPYHPEHTQSHLVSKVNQRQAWLALGWKTGLQKRVLRAKQFGHKGGNAIKVPMESLVPPLKNNQG